MASAPVDRLEPLARLQRRCAAALLEPGLAKDDGRAGCDEVDGDAGDDLVAAMRDRGEAVHHGEGDRYQDGHAEADEGGMKDRGCCSAGKSTDQHLAFKTDVEDAGPFGIKAGETGKQQRHREADGRIQHLDDCVERVHLRPPYP